MNSIKISKTDLIPEARLLTAKLGQLEANSQVTKARLGVVLKEIFYSEEWKNHYDSFRAMMLDLEKDYNSSSYSSLYAYFAAARELNGVVSDQQFEEMGISKAQELQKLNRKALATPEVIGVALDPQTSAKDVLKAASAPTDTIPEVVSGTYVDFSIRGWVSDDDLLVLESAREAAMKADPPIPEEWNESKRNLVCQLRLSMEYLSVHKTDEEN